jgi:hypothetical protein
MRQEGAASAAQRKRLLEQSEIKLATNGHARKATIRVRAEAYSENVDEIEAALISAGLPIYSRAGRLVRPILEKWRKISPSQLEIRNSELKQVYGSTFSVNTAAKNNSKYRVSAVQRFTLSRDRGTARATLGKGLAVSAFPLSVPV